MSRCSDRADFVCLRAPARKSVNGLLITLRVTHSQRLRLQPQLQIGWCCDHGENPRRTTEHEHDRRLSRAAAFRVARRAGDDRLTDRAATAGGRRHGIAKRLGRDREIATEPVAASCEGPLLGAAWPARAIVSAGATSSRRTSSAAASCPASWTRVRVVPTVGARGADARRRALQI